MAELLKGKEVADAIRSQLQKQIEQLSAPPALAIVRVGEKPGDVAYERSVIKAASQAGVGVRQCVYKEEIPQEALLAEVEGLNRDASIHGVLIFRPLPAHIDDSAVRKTLGQSKDVDGITAGSLAGVFTGEAQGFPPCTAKACVEILDYYGIDLAGKKVTVLGRSLVVGKPVAMMAMARNATITVCHSKTPKDVFLKAAREADILITALGEAKIIGGEYLSPGQTVIDVGINTDLDGSLCGDVDREAAEPIVRAITPVPGGVGTVTTAVLLKHVAEAAVRQEASRG